MSTNKNEKAGTEENKEEMLYRPQLLKYKYKTCLEKPKFSDEFDPDTMNSLKALMQSTSFKPVTKPNLKLENSKDTLNYTTRRLKTDAIAQSQEVLMPQWLKYDKNVLKFKGYF